MVDFGCKYCGSTNIVRYGTTGGVQYWWCKDCKRKFADNDALPEMKTPIRQISSALSMYYRGMSIDEIRGHLDQQFNNRPSSSTVYDWLCRFTTEASNKARNYKPNVGNVWIADETLVDIGGKKVWFWDLLDVKTRFLLASHMSFNRTAQHAKALVEKASRRSSVQDVFWHCYPTGEYLHTTLLSEFCSWADLSKHLHHLRVSAGTLLRGMDMSNNKVHFKTSSVN